MQCGKCKKMDCYLEQKECTGIKEEILELYTDPEKQKMMEAAIGLESEDGRLLTRVEEIVKFADRMGYKHLGIAFCAGCSREGASLHKLLENSFKITSVCCSVCGIGIKDVLPDCPDEGNRKVICNPLGQAEILNRAETELNIVVGLCVGHDILFARSSHAPTTTLVVKDRVLVNNPGGVLNSLYWKKIISDRFNKIFKNGETK